MLELGKDWTVNPKTHRSNSSVEYLRLSVEVERLIRNSGSDIVNGRVDRVAGLIMAQLVLSPRRKVKR